MRIEKRPRTVYDEIYIADDGTQFDNKDDCLVHEKAIDQIKAEVERLEIKAMEDYMPCDGEDHNPDFGFKWYKATCQKDIALINEYHGIDDGWKLKADAFPVVVCVEEGEGEAWGYYLEDSIRYVTRFFRNLGVSIELKGVEPKEYVSCV